MKQPPANLPWPEGNETVDFEALCAPIVKALRFAYRLTRRNRTKDIPYRGYGTPYSAAGCPEPLEHLTAANLAFSKEDQGRDALTEIMGVAIRLGIEQGIRIGRVEALKDLRIRPIILRQLRERHPEEADVLNLLE